MKNNNGLPRRVRKSQHIVLKTESLKRIRKSVNNVRNSKFLFINANYNISVYKFKLIKALKNKKNLSSSSKNQLLKSCRREFPSHYTKETLLCLSETKLCSTTNLKFPLISPSKNNKPKFSLKFDPQNSNYHSDLKLKLNKLLAQTTTNPI